MPTDLKTPETEIPPLGRNGSMAVLPDAERGNATTEELAWRMAMPKPGGRSIFFEGPAERGNATAEELTWPVVRTG